jgi:hypothetical protein
MTWLALLSGLVKLAGALADWLGARQLLQAGQAQAIAEGLKGVLTNVEAAKQARAGLADGRERDRIIKRFTRDDK